MAKTLLPTRGLPVFDGDPLHYRSFIKAFQHGIECKTDTMQDRLYYLAEYKSDQPRELVRSCLHMNPARLYNEAKKPLEFNLVNEMKEKNCTYGKSSELVIKPVDGKALYSYALFLKGCSHTLQDIKHTEELENVGGSQMSVQSKAVHSDSQWTTLPRQRKLLYALSKNRIAAFSKGTVNRSATYTVPNKFGHTFEILQSSHPLP